MAHSTTDITVKIGSGPDNEYRDLIEYTIDSNVLTLVDTFSITLADPGGVRTAKITPGDPATLYMQDPAVSGGDRVQVLKGLVTDVDRSSDERSGTVVNVQGADLGWHLVNSCGPLFKTVMNSTFQQFLKIILDPSWGFAGVAADNDFNRKILQGLRLNQSRAGIAAAFSAENTFIPPVCFEAGETLADKLITYARRAKKLVNVSGDGYLQLFAPNYKVDVSSAYTLHYHRRDEASSDLNNVKSSRTHSSIEGVYTDVICIGTVAVPSVQPDRFNPHAGTFRAEIKDKTALPFNRLLTFCDGDSMTQTFAQDRVKQKFQRGLFDSFVANYKILGHVMGGTYITPDTMCNINDTVNHVEGNYYISQRQFNRTKDGGTTTALTLRKPNLLRA